MRVFLLGYAGTHLSALRALLFPGARRGCLAALPRQEPWGNPWASPWAIDGLWPDAAAHWRELAGPDESLIVHADDVHYHHVPGIRSAWPDAQLVWVARDPLDSAVAFLHEAHSSAWWGERALPATVRRAGAAEDAVGRFLLAYAWEHHRDALPVDLFMSYEAIDACPEGAQKFIYDALGLGDPPGLGLSLPEERHFWERYAGRPARQIARLLGLSK